MNSINNVWYRKNQYLADVQVLLGLSAKLTIPMFSP